jgi:hypothetical protein
VDVGVAVGEKEDDCSSSTQPLWCVTGDMIAKGDEAMYLVAIDPLALILSNTVFVRINLPRPSPDLAVLRELVKSMTAEERRSAQERTREISEYAKALEKVLGGPDT